MPGCGSATEISQAEELGVKIVKVFLGAEVGGPGFVKAVLGPMPWTCIMPTGGADANEAGRSAVRPSATYQDVDRAARQVLVDAGFGEYFIHRTEHGLGLDVHEERGIVEGNDIPLEEGMVFTTEPGVYLEGWGGIRIEDNLVVTADGCESLTTFSRELRVVAS